MAVIQVSSLILAQDTKFQPIWVLSQISIGRLNKNGVIGGFVEQMTKSVYNEMQFWNSSKEKSRAKWLKGKGKVTCLNGIEIFISKRDEVGLMWGKALGIFVVHKEQHGMKWMVVLRKMEDDRKAFSCRGERTLHYKRLWAPLSKIIPNARQRQTATC